MHRDTSVNSIREKEGRNVDRELSYADENKSCWQRRSLRKIHLRRLEKIRLFAFTRLQK